MRISLRFACIALVFFCAAVCGAEPSQKQKRQKPLSEPIELSVFKKAYPDVHFSASYDKEKKDFLITVSKKNSDGSRGKKTELYWCEGRFLPESELENKAGYRRMLYHYEREVPDPRSFTAEEIDGIKGFTSSENRRNGAIDPPFLYNAIYECDDRISTEQRIIKMDFLTKSVNVHERIAEPLRRVSERVMALERDDEMQTFFSTLVRTDGYAWRSVRDTKSRSFHSLGLAIDVLPRGYYQKVIYWGWQKQLDPENWYLTPLSKRWMPPQRVIDIFADEGFIWGGTWIVWDNMHFEYHPELLVYKEYLEKTLQE